MLTMGVKPVLKQVHSQKQKVYFLCYILGRHVLPRLHGIDTYLEGVKDFSFLPTAN